MQTNNRNSLWCGLGSVVIAAVLSGCAGANATPIVSSATPTDFLPATPTESEQGGAAPSSAEPQNTPTYVLPPPTGGVVGGPAEAGTGTDVTGLPTGQSEGAAGPPATDESGELAITLADNGKTITLKTGQTFLLKLDMAFNWVIDLQGGDVIVQVMTFAPIPGAQGMYSANRPGRASLSAIGSLPCHSETPPCMAPSPSFEVTLVVE